MTPEDSPRPTGLCIDGPVGAADVAELLGRARETAALDGAVAVELGRAGHLHALAVQVLIALERTVVARGRTFTVQDPSDEARDALALAGLQRWLS